MLDQGIPTLDDLFQKWRENKSDLQASISYFQQIAAGQRPPLIRESSAIFAAQTMMILVKHFLELEKTNAITQTTTTEESNNCQGPEYADNSAT